jgi:nucleoside-diphosphate-sugar epimerase
MNILITGASGRIGKNLVPALLERGHRVRALVLPEEKHKIEDFDIECIVGKLEDASIYPSLMKGIEAVYHLGALLPQGATNEQIFQVNIRGTYNILESLVENGVKLSRFIFASSDEVYSSLNPRYLPLDEFHPHYPYSLYGFSKVFGEDLCQFYFREHGIPIVISRFTFTIEAKELADPSSVAGGLFYVNRKLELLKQIENPSQEVVKQMNMFEQMAKKHGESVYISYDEDGSPYEMTICDVRDLVKGLLLILENENVVGEAIGFGPPCSFTFDRMVSYLAEKTGLPCDEVKLSSSLSPKFNISIAKAKTFLGYDPEWDIYSMIDDAIKSN